VWRQWTLLGISLVFCAGAVFIWQTDWRTAVATLAFFGSGALVFLANILRRRRERSFSATRVRIVGGVNIFMSRARFVSMAVGCIALGSVLYFVGTNYPPLFRYVSAFIAIVGLALLVLLLTGVLRRHYIRFEPEGIVIQGMSFGLRVPWDQITAVKPFEYADNPFVGLDVSDPSQIAVQPPKRQARFLRMLANSRGLMGCDIVIAPRNYGMDSPPLVAALARYVREPAARVELAPPAAPDRKALTSQSRP
jgi:hypothetical protein